MVLIFLPNFGNHKTGKKKNKQTKFTLDQIYTRCLLVWLHPTPRTKCYLYVCNLSIYSICIYMYIWHKPDLPWPMTDSIYKLHMGNKGLHMTLCLFSGEPLEWEQNASFLFTSIGRWCTPFCGRIFCLWQLQGCCMTWVVGKWEDWLDSRIKVISHVVKSCTCVYFEQDNFKALAQWHATSLYPVFGCKMTLSDTTRESNPQPFALEDQTKKSSWNQFLW